MELQAKDLMQKGVRTVTPDTPLAALECLFMDQAVSGFPVVADGKLEGVVSRSDVVRQLCIEQSFAEQGSDFYSEFAIEKPEPGKPEEIARKVGKRLEELRVKDLMIRRFVKVTPDASLEEVAGVFLEHHVHRLIVAKGETLLGIISSLDLVRLIRDREVKLDV